MVTTLLSSPRTKRHILHSCPVHPVPPPRVYTHIKKIGQQGRATSKQWHTFRGNSLNFCSASIHRSPKPKKRCSFAPWPSVCHSEVLRFKLFLLFALKSYLPHTKGAYVKNTRPHCGPNCPGLALQLRFQGPCFQTVARRPRAQSTCLSLSHTKGQRMNTEGVC